MSDEHKDDDDREPPPDELPDETPSPGSPTRTGEPTTLRFQGVGEHEKADSEGRGLSAEDQATIDALRPGTALLVVLRGPNTGARFLLDDAEVSSGRHPDSDIFLDDVTVSRKHALFVREGGGYAVQDVGSLNGTYVNRAIVDQAVLRTGDEVQIGKFRLVYYGRTR
jgi:pSer/pThr/pTyr-binding forkhead associated (FHA) protein